MRGWGNETEERKEGVGYWTHRNIVRLQDGDLGRVEVDIAVGFGIAEPGLHELW